MALGQGPRAQGPGEFLLNPATEGEGLKEGLADHGGQHLVAQMMLGTVTWLLQPRD